MDYLKCIVANKIAFIFVLTSLIGLFLLPTPIGLFLFIFGIYCFIFITQFAWYTYQSYKTTKEYLESLNNNEVLFRYKAIKKYHYCNYIGIKLAIKEKETQDVYAFIKII